LLYDSETVKIRPASQAGEAELEGRITKEDSAIKNLHILITDLTAQIQRLDDRIIALQKEATVRIQNKNKPGALAALRRKTVAMKQVQSRRETLGQLEDVYSSIENAADQVSIISTLKESAEVLKVLNRRVGEVGDVEDVMDALREEMGKTSELQGVLNEDLGDGIGEADVDEEFEAMEREEREKVEKTKEEERVRETERRLRELGSANTPTPQIQQSQQKEQNPTRIEANKELEERWARVANGDIAHASSNSKADMDVDAEMSRSIEKLEAMSLANQSEDQRQQRKEERVFAS
jgi:charged multivesicular body protein 7